MDSEAIVCRLCLEVVPTGYTLLKENISNIIESLTSINVSENDNLPKLSCSKCIYNLYFVESIRKSIIKADERLRSLFLRDGNFNELLKRANPLELTSEQTNENEPTLENEEIHVEIKEEKVRPLSVELEQYDEELEQCDDEELGQCDEELGLYDDAVNGEIETQHEDSITEHDDVKDENVLNSIIYRKDNSKPYLYHCNVCNVDFRGNKLYMVHKGKHMKKTCEICGVTTRRDNFNKHMTNHTLGQQICDICGSIHKSLEGLRTHLFHFHNANKKPYTCDICGEKFKYSHRLSYHKRKIHTGFRPHQCESCGKRFFDLGTMKKHVKLIHLKLREYPCKHCGKDYSSRHALKVHTRQHTDETPYVCEFCTEGFRQLVSLKTHLARHHKEKPSTSQTDAEDIQDEVA